MAAGSVVSSYKSYLSEIRSGNTRWEISCEFTDFDGNVIEGESRQVIFALNPTSVRWELVSRVSVRDTIGGNVVVAWNGENNVWSGYPRLNIILSGVGNVYRYGSEAKEKEKQLDVVTKLLSYMKVPLGTGLSKKDRVKIEEALVNVVDEKKRVYGKRGFYINLLALYRLVNMYWVRGEDGSVARWRLSFVTPVFDKIGGVPGDKINRVYVLKGYPTAPMRLEENADRPWLPSWSFTFSVFGSEVKVFMEEIAVQLKRMGWGGKL